MIERKSLISATEVQFALRLGLGPLRAWSDFLADCNRDRTNLFGLQLLPYGTRKMRAVRPMYCPAEVGDFIRAVWAEEPSLKKSWRALDKNDFMVDTAPALPWRCKARQVT